MVDRDNDRIASAGPFGTPGHGPEDRAPWTAALVAAAVWMVLVGGAFIFLGSGAEPEAPFSLLRAAGVAAVIVLPPVLGVLLALAIHMVQRLDQMSDRLAALPGLPGAAGSGRGTSPAELAAKLDRLLDGQRRLDGVLARGAAPRAEPSPATEPSVLRQPSSPAPRKPAAGTAPAERETAPRDPAARGDAVQEPSGQPLSFEDFVTALQFPADAQDKEGFKALRRALHDQKASQLVTAAQDILTLLSQDGIYMDEMRPESASPAQWRIFAEGGRSPEIEAIGTVANEEALDRIADRMRQDTIFRDAAHHFLRLFDHIFSEIAPDLGDEDVAALLETRTARAFMLLGRAAGTFD
ncbi:hypothetical protein [Profundibacterium mesophilum]|uniref:Alpha-ketoglutarate decarboxylase n=1 Tax=Profundibacterium mesophilum KAUST100406-0324 TaxID=1037889 RepID=A0A921TDL7_9RHOB|nr:hypothetical protein [Profundibacterium mesophilum]KAF0676471.1 alpha-ketoglutarate decarboxylase [Profundibacterium mesophilum KAUST100406-0324]